MSLLVRQKRLLQGRHKKRGCQGMVGKTQWNTTNRTRYLSRSILSEIEMAIFSYIESPISRYIEIPIYGCIEIPIFRHIELRYLHVPKTPIRCPTLSNRVYHLSYYAVTLQVRRNKRIYECAKLIFGACHSASGSRRGPAGYAENTPRLFLPFFRKTRTTLPPTSRARRPTWRSGGRW